MDKKFAKPIVLMLVMIALIFCLSSCKMINDKINNYRNEGTVSQTEDTAEDEEEEPEPEPIPEPIDVSFHEIELTIPAGYEYDTQDYSSNKKVYVVTDSEGVIEKQIVIAYDTGISGNVLKEENAKAFCEGFVNSEGGYVRAKQK